MVHLWKIIRFVNGQILKFYQNIIILDWFQKFWEKSATFDAKTQIFAIFIGQNQTKQIKLNIYL